MPTPSTPNKVVYPRRLPSALSALSSSLYLGQLVPQKSNPSPHAEPATLTSEQVNSVRNARTVLWGNSENAFHPCTLEDMFHISQACVASYSSCAHPIRSDLLHGITSALTIAIDLLSRSDCPQSVLDNILSDVGFDLPDSVNHVQSLHVLSYALDAGRCFAPPRLALNLASAFRDALIHLPPAYEDEFVQSSLPFLKSMVTVASATFFPGGVGFVAPSAGPQSAAHATKFEDQGVTLSVAYAPRFVCALSFSPESVSVALDRAAMRTFLSLFVFDHFFAGQGKYPHASIDGLIARSRATLKIGKIISVACPPQRYLAIQRVCAKLIESPEYTAWTDFRAQLFGDL